MNYKLGIVVLILLAVTNAFSFYKGYDFGKEKIKAEWNTVIIKTTDEKLEVKGKQDEIRNAPVDSNVTIRRLRNSTF